MLGGGASTVLDMIMRLRSNNRMLRKTNLFKKGESFFEKRKNGVRSPSRKLIFKTSTTEQLIEIRKQMAKSRRKERLVVCGLFILAVSLVYLLVTSLDPFSSKNPYQEELARKQRLEEKVQLDNYKFYLEDGDQWSYQNHWNNAIFQYKKALEIFPHDFAANYRLSLAYVFSCRDTKENCQIAEKMIDQLIETYPENPDVQQLVSIYYGFKMEEQEH